MHIDVFFLKKDFINLFLERGEGRERGKHQCVVASHAPPTGDPAYNPGISLWFAGQSSVY